jgi:hypothetical protein
MNSIHQVLVKQIVDEVQTMPENLVREVLDFVGYLRTKYTDDDEADRQEAFLATFGSWEDTREAEEIIDDIYMHRTVSELVSGL